MKITISRLPHGEGLRTAFLRQRRRRRPRSLRRAGARTKARARTRRPRSRADRLRHPSCREVSRRRSGRARGSPCCTASPILNAPGTIDSDYRGELHALLVNLGAQPFEIVRGMRIAQLVVAPVTRAHLEETRAALEETERGGGGFGSTGVLGDAAGMRLLPRAARFALMAMLDVALHARARPVSSKELAARHDFPPRRLEGLLQALVRAGILKSLRGPSGGYELARERRRLTAAEIVRVALRAEGDDEERCARRERCVARSGADAGSGANRGLRFRTAREDIARRFARQRARARVRRKAGRGRRFRHIKTPWAKDARPVRKMRGDARVSYETIEIERHGEAGLVRLHRPDALNALNAKLIGELDDAASGVRGGRRNWLRRADRLRKGLRRRRRH